MSLTLTFGGVLVDHHFSFLCSIMCLYVPSYVCCDYDFRINTLFGSSLPPVNCRRSHVSFTLFVFGCVQLYSVVLFVLCMVVSNTYSVVLFVFFVVVCVLCMFVSNTYSVVLFVLLVVVLCLVYGCVQLYSVVLFVLFVVVCVLCPTHMVLCYLSCLSSSCVLCMVVSNTYSVVLFVLFVVVLCLVYGCVQLYSVVLFVLFVVVCVLCMVVFNTYSVVLFVLFVVVLCLVYGCVQHI